jgi:undecaprenyl-diphosphatase
VVPEVAGSSPVGRPYFIIKGKWVLSVSFIEAILLGIIQGITEFFPVSSSGHLKLLKLLFGINEASASHLFFDLICHVGTLIAAVFFLRKEILELFFNQRKRFFKIMIATLPLVPVYFLLKPVREYFSHPIFLGYFLFITGIFLFITSRYEPKQKINSSVNPKIRDVLFIGTMQALALIPGISRSASTISAACWRGWHIKEAVTFSFLLAIPTIIGGSIIESYKAISWHNFALTLPLSHYFIGFVASFVTGIFSVRVIFALANKKKILPFAMYCCIIGIATILVMHLL